MTDFYDFWDGQDMDGEPRPVTVDEKIEFGLFHYTGDSGVGDEELRGYLEDLVATSHDEVLSELESWARSHHAVLGGYARLDDIVAFRVWWEAPLTRSSSAPSSWRS